MKRKSFYLLLIYYIHVYILLLPLVSSVGKATELTLPSSFEIGAQLRLRPEVRGNTDYGGNRNYNLMRFRMNAMFRPNTETLIYIQPQLSKVYGQLFYPGNSTTANLVQPTSGYFYDTPFTIHQAYFDYRPFSNFQFLGGRQIFSYGDELLIGGGLGWANIGRSFDALKFVMKYSNIQSDFFWSRLVDTSSLTTTGNGSADFIGFYNTFDISKSLRNFDLYLLYLSDTRNSSNTSVLTTGTRLKSSIDFFDYRIELDYQTGSTLSVPQTAGQADFEFGLQIHPQSKFRISIGGFVATAGFNQLFAAAHKWLGTADVLGRRNVTGGILKTSISPLSQWVISCDLYQFYRTSTDSPAYKLNGMIPLGSPQQSSASSIGSEFDFSSVFQLSNFVTLSTGISTLFSNTYLIQNFGNINPMYAFLEIEARY